MLYHISEEGGIERFEPRPATGHDYPVVWAISEDRLRNYLLPRDCPRVTFFGGAKTSAEDVARFLGSSSAVVAIEAGWLDRIRQTKLYCYHLPRETFHLVDRCAGYFHSKETVVPEGVEVIEDLLAAIVSRGVELRVMPSLWELHDAVVASTLSYSMIRMRNATRRLCHNP
ncbi:MAG TPA: hypothetical protein VG722_00680 [Tepidisphaeraceae bacterium]|nr:hypothetical protein [Tepidisphaeraceae bacterium]